MSYKDAPDYDPVKLDRDNPDQLARTLTNDNMFWRITAQRLLVETGNKEVAGKLYDLARNHDLDETGNNPSALHALWTLHGLGLMDGSDREALDVAVEALKHPAPGVRTAARSEEHTSELQSLMRISYAVF